MFYRAIACVTIGLTLSGCSKDPQKLKAEFFANGNRYMTQGKKPEAIIEYRKAIGQDAMFGEARLALGNAYLVSGDARNALAELIRAADLMPKNVDAQIQAGKLLLITTQYQEAKARAMKALELQPSNSDALVLLGHSMAGMKDLDGAIVQVEKAIESNPERELTYANLGALERARGNAPAAEEAFKRAVAVAPKSVFAHMGLANYYWATRQIGKAEDELKIAHDLSPEAAGVNKALAVLYLTTNRQTEAETHLKALANFSPDIQDKLHLPDYYVAANRVPDAMRELQLLSKSKDGFIPATRRHAALQFAQGQRSQAYQSIEEILKQQPRNEEALLQKGRFLLLDGKPADALLVTDMVLKGNAGSAGGHYIRGVALNAKGDRQGAIGAMQEVLKLSPNVAGVEFELAGIYMAAKQPARALELLSHVLKRQPTFGAAHLMLAEAQLDLGNLPAAETQLRRVQAANPKSPQVLVLAGRLYAAQNKNSQARAAYERALSLQPGDPNALVGIVRLDIAEKQGAAARARVDKALTVAPNDVRLLMMSSSVYAATGDLKNAEASFKRVLELDPSKLEAYDALGSIYMSQHRLEEAKTTYLGVAEREPKAALAATTMVGVILTLQGKHDEASVQYQRVLDLQADMPVAANNLAWYYASSGKNLDVALKLAQSAKSKLPENWQIDDTMGWIYYQKGLVSLAIASLQEGAKRNAAGADVHYHLGLAYAKSGDRVRAKEALQRALQLNPAFDGADEAKKVLASLTG